MRDFAKESATYHAQDHHLGRTIAAVLQNDAMLASGFRSLDEVPALLQSCTGRHFDGSMLAILHDAERHRNVPVPRGGYVDDVELELGQILEIPFALAEPCGFWLAWVCDRLLRSRHFFRHQIADRLHLHIFNCEQILQQAGTASADADNSQTHAVCRLERDTDHGRVRTLGCAGTEVGTQNVIRNQKPRTADRGALYETPSRDCLRSFIRCHVAVS